MKLLCLSHKLNGGILHSLLRPPVWRNSRAQKKLSAGRLNIVTCLEAHKTASPGILGHYFGSYPKTSSKGRLLAMRHGLPVSFGACHLQGRGWRTIFVACIATRELRILIWFANVVYRIHICIMKARGLHKLFVLRFFLYAESHTTLRPLCLWVKEREYKRWTQGPFKNPLQENYPWAASLGGKCCPMFAPNLSPFFHFSLAMHDTPKSPWVLWSCGRALPLLMGLPLCKINLVPWIRR